MNKALEIIAKPRATVLEIIKPLTIEQLNIVPTGFRNNIIWNLGHMVAVQQGICYKRSGAAIVIDEEFFDIYKSGSKPERFLDASDFDKIVGLFTSTIIQLEEDLKADKFTNYPTWTTRYGVDVTNINDAVAFLPFHEGLHIGTVVAMSKIVSV